MTWNSEWAQRQKRISMRRGSMLIEMALCMIIGSSLLTLAITLVHQVMHFSSQARYHATMGSNMNQLERQFREDIHQASAIQLESPSKVTVSQINGDVVQYSFAETQMLREHRGPNSSDNENVRRERFTLENDFAAEFVLENTNPQRVSLQMSRPERSKNAPRTVHNITSVLKKDVKLLRKNAKELPNGGLK